MDNKIILILTILMCVGIVFFDFDKVKAETYSGDIITGEYVPNMYIKKLKPDGSGRYQQGRVLRRSTDNVFVYCLQPFVDINNDYVYNITTDDYATILNITQQQWQRISLLSYYGYQYGNHTDLKWYYITQVLIWRTADPTANIFFTNTLNGNRNDNLYSSEIAEIEDLVAKHYVVPNFNLSDITMTLGQTITLNDTNNILSRFNISQQINVSASINNNQLNITATGIGDISLVLSKTDSKYTTPPIVYYSDNTQNAMAVGRYDPVNLRIAGKVNGGKIKITKVDSETNLATPQGAASLAGARYNVYDANNNIVSTLTIGNDSTATTDYLPLGTYTVREVASSTGYYLDGTVYTVNVNSSSTINLTVKETVIKGRIKILKNDRETQSCQAQGEATLVGAKYGIYDKNNNLVDTVVIDENCTGISKQLPYGDYKVKEIEAPTGYNLSGDILEVMLRNSNTAAMYVEESVIKGRVQLLKVDSETNSTIPQGEATLVGAKYGIYDSKNNLVETLVIDEYYQAISSYLPYGNYTVKEIEAPVGYEKDKKVYSFTITTDYSMSYITSKETVIKGQIKITKVDSETNLPIPQGEATLVGAKYGVYDSKNNLVDTIIIGEDSTATTKLLPYGKYTIRELENSTGYYLNTEVYKETITEKITYPITVKEDVIKNRFEFYKFYGNLDNGTGIIYAEPNAVFEIVNNKSEVVATIKTDKNGYATISLPYGNYQVKQKSGLDDYKLMYPISIRVNEDTSLTQTNYMNNGTISAKLKLVKVDSETNKVIELSGVKFKIKDKKSNKYICQTTNEVICEYETNDKGIMITPLPLFGGDYIIEEIKAPTGYLLSNQGIEFSIKENIEIIEDEIYGSLIEIHFENKEVKGAVEINKLGEKFVIENGSYTYEEIKLPNVKFGLYDESGNLIKEVYTDEFGYARIDNLKLGKYVLKELASSNSHLLDPTEYEFELVYKDQYTEVITKTFTLKNYLGKGTIDFTKLDISTSNPLPNTLIEIYKADTEELIFSGYTNDKGKIVIKDLYLGKYYLLEKEAPVGYILNEEKMYFEILENGEVVKTTMTNEKIKGTLEFTKIDVSTSESLPNTLIEVYKADTEELIFSGYTDESGKIIIENIEYGKYYLLEKEAPVGYILNEEKMYFEILENGEVVKTTMTNEKIEMPKTFNTDLIGLFIIGGTALTGLCLLLYARKKKD